MSCAAQSIPESHPATHARPLRGRAELSSRERGELLRLSRGQRVQRRLVERAAIVLALSQGHSIRAVSQSLGRSKNTVRKWADRYVLRRQARPDRPVPESLQDAPRSGRPPEFTEQQCVQVLSLATSDPQTEGVPTSHWSCRDLARVSVESGRFAHLSKSHVQRLLNKGDLKPHRVKMWLNRPEDPEYDARATEVTQLLCDATESAHKGASEQTPESAPEPLSHAVVSFDEKSGMQALERTAADRPCKPGRPAQPEYEYRRHGTRTLLSLMHVNTGRISGFVLPQRTCQDTAMALRIFLGTLLMQGYARVTVILDQLNTHMCMDVVRSVAALCEVPVPDERELSTRARRRAFLESPGRRIRFLFTPRHASWLNPIEKWFSYLARRLLRRASFRSLEELTARVTEFIRYCNDHLARPYRFRRRSYGPAAPNPCSPAQGSGTWGTRT
jgi:transposase